MSHSYASQKLCEERKRSSLSERFHITDMAVHSTQMQLSENRKDFILIVYVYVCMDEFEIRLFKAQDYVVGIRLCSLERRERLDYEDESLCVCVLCVLNFSRFVSVHRRVSNHSSLILRCAR